jgi:hypothetical protein
MAWCFFFFFSAPFAKKEKRKRKKVFLKVYEECSDRPSRTAPGM